MRSDGSIWSSDPTFGITSDYEGHRAESEIGAANVYRVAPGTGEVRLAADGFGGPKDNRLFITASATLYCLVMAVTGVPRVHTPTR